MASRSNYKRQPWSGGWLTKGMSLAQKLDFFTDKSGGPDSCWIWIASCNGLGYGKVAWDKKLYLAHRVRWEIERGPIAIGLFLCHRCDNPGCNNTRHLFVGDHKANMADMMQKERGVRGAAQWMAKLTEDAVRAIRSDGRTQKATAAAYGVSQATVQLIRSGKTWKHIT